MLTFKKHSKWNKKEHFKTLTHYLLLAYADIYPDVMSEGLPDAEQSRYILKDMLTNIKYKEFECAYNGLTKLCYFSKHSPTIRKLIGIKKKDPLEKAYDLLSNAYEEFVDWVSCGAIELDKKQFKLLEEIDYEFVKPSPNLFLIADSMKALNICDTGLTKACKLLRSLQRDE